MEENFIVEINMPLEKRKKLQEQYNKTLEQFQNFLQANFGTSNVQAATAIIVAELTTQIAINIATLGLGGVPTEIKLFDLEVKEDITITARLLTKQWLEERFPDLYPVPQEIIPDIYAKVIVWATEEDGLDYIEILRKAGYGSPR